ncbi:dihydrofolate reductase family protein [Nonomuraea sp. LPB2021202275-12-8]|uniref:dihydrofolate reductase family protein n=1 Tax=Nonomuraea sp. LPB2021202275-12-8 TaxID=3120159 RepID=UPI00300D15D2
MKKIVAGLFISLDGVVEAPQKWHFPYYDEDMGRSVGWLMERADVLLLGRRTYEEFAAHWPHQDPAEPLAATLNNITKYVVSGTLDTASWQNTTIISGDVAARLTELKRQPGKDITISGSPTLVTSLLRDGLLDELHLLVHPIVIGSGQRLFEDGIGEIPLKLTASESFNTGVLDLTYERA